ncbi:MAG: hypothetical protein KQJ78_10535 [Deltaproteobacteria bacterium]|nr:hypothetical protein [Deltaproteobacteria bacterium]
MLDPAVPTPIDLSDFDTYLATCCGLAQERLGGYASLADLDQDQAEVNRYPRLEELTEPRQVRVLDQGLVPAAAETRAGEALLGGRILLEHTCAGEATRLGLGTKYLITPPRDLTPEVLARFPELQPQGWRVKPAELRPLSLGRRHMLQLAWDIRQLAESAGQDPAAALARQTLLIIMNEATHNEVREDFREARFYGFDPSRVLFMVQRSFPGLTRAQGAWRLAPDSPRRLHNHGQMLMQTTMEGQIFRLDAAGGRQTLSWPEFQDLCAGFDDKISFNIEDMDYLSSSLDLLGLAGALKLGEEGYRMVMEVVTNDPDNPQKGGALAWDPELGRDVMIESFQLKGVANQDITHLNRNINHYPRPAEMLTQVRERGLSMPIAVKQGYLYFQPVQGDVNFLVPTAFVRRPVVQSIRAWKSAANTPAALEAMAAQERRPGFLAWAAGLTGLAL